MDNYETGIYTDNPDDTLRYMKSAEVVEVVRCKYCDHWDKKTHVCDRNRLFERWAEDDFCIFGERREKWSNISKAE